MLVLTDEPSALCPLWRHLTGFWPETLLAMPRRNPTLLGILPDLQVIWLRADPAASFSQLLALVDELMQRERPSPLVVCLERATPDEMQELLQRGADEILFMACILAEPCILPKTLLTLERARERQKATEAALGQERAALQGKTETLAWLSHEIRTPMNGVLGLLELFPRQVLNPEQQDMLDVMSRSSQRIIDLVSEVLDMSRLEAGKMARSQSDFHLRRLVADTIQLYARDAQRRGLLISYTVEPDVPDGLVGDERKLSQILNNLVSNAVKYTSVGHVLLKVRLESRNEAACRLLVEVQDSGHGIAPEEFAKVFAPFEQTHSAQLNRSPSSGLGLSLTKSLVELLGGSIHLESRLGEGSSFFCSLPFSVQENVPRVRWQPSRAHAPKGHEPRPARPLQEPPSRRAYVLRQRSAHDQRRPDPALNFQGARILVVDDDPVNLQVAARQLQRLQAACTLATSAAEALKCLEEKHFDLIFVDCQMPHVDGFTLVKLIRELPQFIPGTPVIALTGLSRAEDREQALQCGFTDLLAKPTQLEHIRALLTRWLPSALPLSES